MLDALAEWVNKLTSKQVDGLTGKFANLEGTPAANIRPDVQKLHTRHILSSVNCLHSALFVCTALIISVLRSVDNLAFCLHAVYTCLHSSTLVCTLSARPSLHLSAPNCTMVMPPAQFGIGGAIFWLERPKKLPPFIVLTAFSRALRHAAVAEAQRKN